MKYPVVGREERLIDNEAYRRAAGPGVVVETPRGVDPQVHSFRCECLRDKCDLPVDLRLSEYDGLPDDADHFLVHPEHVDECDVIVHDRRRYVVVRKS